MNQITEPDLPVPAFVAAIAAMVLALAAMPAGGQEIPAEDHFIDRHSAVAMALQSNPGLRVAGFEVTRARAKLVWAGKLNPPGIEASATTDRFGLNDDESVLEIGIAQKFPLTGRLKHEKNVSRVAVALAEAEIANTRRKLIAEVERAFVFALSAEEQVALLSENRKIHLDHVEELKGEAAQGTVSALDVNQARLELKSIERNLKQRGSESTSRTNRLKTLLGVKADAILKLTGGLSLPEKQEPAPDPSASRERRPDFQLSVLKEDEARAELTLAAAKRWEDAAIRLFAEREAAEDAPEGLERNSFVGIGISIPLPMKKERATAEKTVAVDQASENSRAVAFNIENEILTAARIRSEMHQLAVEASGDVVDLAEENLDAIAKAYRNGQIELLKYQRAQEQLIEAKLGALEALEAWHTAEINLREAAAIHPSIRPPLPRQK